MRSIIICLFTFITATQGFAGSKSLIVIAGSRERVVSATLLRQADFFSCPVSIVCDQKAPEKRFRDMQILKRIKEEITQVKDIFEPNGKMSVTGLENPVTVGQADDQNVELYIEYTLLIEKNLKQ